MNEFYKRTGLYAAFFSPSDEIRGSIDRVVRKHLGRAPRRVIDPACGPGLWLAHFAKKGAEVAGTDLEESAIALAVESLPKRVTVLPAQAQAVKDYLASHCAATAQPAG